MKVLMFGWEFPPHISGGLGTACFGLTQSLSASGVKVYFVVPRLFGDETEKNAVLINASEVGHAERTRQASAKKVNKVYRTKTRGYEDRVGKQRDITYIEIPATLAPYGHTHPGRQPGTYENLSQWNYSMVRDSHFDTVFSETILGRDQLPDSDIEENFAFSGLYGANLMDEIQRYASVAGAIVKKYPCDVIHAHD